MGRFLSAYKRLQEEGRFVYTGFQPFMQDPSLMRSLHALYLFINHCRTEQIARRERPKGLLAKLRGLKKHARSYACDRCLEFLTECQTWSEVHPCLRGFLGELREVVSSCLERKCEEALGKAEKIREELSEDFEALHKLLKSYA